MKKFMWFLCLLGCIALTTQAGNYRKREVTHPCFVTTNTSEIEIKKIILTDEHTQVDAVLYGKPGEAAIISSNTYLCDDNQNFRYGKPRVYRLTDKPFPNGFPIRESKISSCLLPRYHKEYTP